MRRLQQGEAPVLGKMTVEGDGLWDIQALHDYEAEGVAEGVGLVPVRTQEGDSADAGARHVIQTRDSRTRWSGAAQARYSVGVGGTRVSQ